jgi:DNA-binding transcriptional MocR family regulator
MRLAFSFQTEEKIADGIQRLGAAMQEFRERKK